MPLYLSRFSYTPETWARLIGNPEDRRKAAESYIESVGGKLHGFWYAFGTHDGYTLWEAPDNVSMAAVALAISGGGALSSLETTVLLTVEETMDALRKAEQIQYRRPARSPGSSHGLEPDKQRCRASRRGGLGAPHAGGASTRDPQPWPAPRGALARPDSGRSALPAGPLRHPGGRREQLAADARWASRTRVLAVARRAPGAAGEDAGRDPGVRRQRPRVARASPGEPALAARGRRNRRVDRHPAEWSARSGRRRGGCGRGRLPRARSRHRGRRGAELRAQPVAVRCAPRRGAGGLGDERRAAAAATRLPRPADRAGLVRDDERQVARSDHGSRSAVRRLPTDPQLSPPPDPGRAGPGTVESAPEVAGGSAGIPDFATRERRLEAGPCTLRGRAWSGLGPIERVDVSVDGGGSWSSARLGSPRSEWSWISWQWDWDAEPGVHEVCCRAVDAGGNEQPLEPAWNLGGYANNEVQRLAVTVAPSGRPI